MRHRRLFLSALILGSTVVPVTDAVAQSGQNFLLELPGNLVGVRYSPGSLDRAVSVQERLEQLVGDFGSWSKARVALVVLLLSREEWSDSDFENPYGVPEQAGGRGLALSAWGDDGTAQLWRQLLGARLPTLPDRPLRGTAEQAASLAVGDLIAHLEASRLLLAAGGIKGDRPWVDGLLAHAVTLAVIQGHEATRLPDVRYVFSNLAKQGGGPAAYALSAAQSPPSLSARLWFESQYFEAASLLSGSAGKAPVRSILKRARKSGGRVAAADLLGEYPGLDRWLHGSFRPE